MEQEHLKTRLNKLLGVLPTKWESIVPQLRNRNLQAGQWFETGRYELLFLHKGTIALIDANSQQYQHFIVAGDIVPDALLDEESSYYTLQDCSILYLKQEIAQLSDQQEPDAKLLMRLILKEWIKRQNIRANLLSLPKSERKKSFKAYYPQLPLVLESKTIAEYLAMAPEYFSKNSW